MNITSPWQYKRILLLSCTLAIIFALLPSRQVTGQQKPEASQSVPAGQNTSDATTYAYIPCVAKNLCGGAAPSPFALQIAGLSDLVVPTNMSQAEAAQFRARQIALYDAAFPSLVKALQESGAGWARVYIDWSQIQPTDPLGGTPTYDWDWYDDKLSQIASAGVQVIATVSNPPAWATISTDPCSNRISLEKKQDFFNFLTALVNRYKVGPYNIHIWEILNEPDGIDGYRCTSGASNFGMHGAEYSELMKGVYPVIKAADTNSKIIMGGIAYDWFYMDPPNQYQDGSPDGKFFRYFIDDVISANGATAIDGVNFHYFPAYAPEWERWTIGDQPSCGWHDLRDPNAQKYEAYGKDLVAKGSHFLNRLKSCYGVVKPLWITEVGQHGTTDPNHIAVYPQDTLENQARYVFKVYARGLSLGAENITWYALKIFIAPGTTPADYQGLLYDSRDPGLENQPKPAFYAFRTLTRELTGHKFDAVLTQTNNAEAYSFSHPCQGTKIIAWNNQSTGTLPLVVNYVKSVVLVYRQNADGSENGRNKIIVDGDGNDLDGKVNGKISVALDKEPVIIQLKQ